MKGFLQRILQEIMKNTWNIRRLVDEAIVYWRLSDFMRWIWYTIRMINKSKYMMIWKELITFPRYCLSYVMTKYASQAYKYLRKGSFTDYVDKILPIIDHLPECHLWQNFCNDIGENLHTVHISWKPLLSYLVFST